ncbi:MAG: hypothetical protein ACXAC8_05260 [Candidatus Hodarchaeales archaeon]|jgi:hypothetical protein
MYSNLLYGIIKENHAEKLATLIECEIIPSVRKQRGWEGWRLVINQDKNKLALRINWHTKEDAFKAAESEVFKQQFSKIYPLLVNKPN